MRGASCGRFCRECDVGVAAAAAAAVVAAAGGGANKDAPVVASHGLSLIGGGAELPRSCDKPLDSLRDSRRRFLCPSGVVSCDRSNESLSHSHPSLLLSCCAGGVL